MKPPLKFSPKKSLGQNFLIDENIARKIVQFLAPQPDDYIVEIGPGFGVLTKYLVPSGCRYLGIEIDQRLVPLLQKEYAAFPRAEILHADFRKVNLAEWAEGTKLRLVGNIPYHITSSLVFAAFAQNNILRDMVLTVQKEVAARIVADPQTGGKDYGILSVISQTFAQTEILFTMSKHVFRPRPEVDSAVVRWTFQPPPENLVDADFFVRMVKAIFGQRRKTLRRSLSAFLGREISVATPVDLQRRPENLSIRELIQLANALLTGQDHNGRTGSPGNSR
ncbi:MAG: 16S rRNA (adenine(1518)-N(6)/adenine(1519)-N(6))-dimethyltransferase RsmA [candidate division KSB1 bacterium]|nr:16S rRNA (adenine(1518)-N(6)/adenine(1519)-N(6))-dimethyltransferase RsmA [candidate division KSB1 bacterium]MDZ7368388.1 16S rRNA (adenine(1518)-N(6)/adenine(1519)-N(6))-dimethyltransferase RsmA [candidate division KSB1 bacterium]MDZ7406036.1 16S rRNA (adenine(1518)-N(6)/adenine(1519)-N(6))-dimethyltransferase RsmA [candidate division KSB1 bacterium]